MNTPVKDHFQQALWRIYQRSTPAVPWRDGVNLPWDDPAFSERMLREHLDQSHGAASRQRPELLRQVDWLWQRLDLHAGARLLDITCGPGLYAVEFARRGVDVTGIDFSPASIRYARELAAEQGLAERCRFIQGDVRAELPRHAGLGYDAATFIYGQLAVFTRAEAVALLAAAAQALRPAGRLALELLDFERIDKSPSTWWFSDNRGLWGDAPFLNLGERFWDAEQRASIDRFFVVHLHSGEMEEIGLSDNGYETGELLALLQASGFEQAWAYPAWDGLDLYDAAEWVAYVAQR
ncbi:MAG TPA: class I SAM-dependent methyltransferase [Anaerolineae bacterium]|nr:class I SAM-dependent methyltransferase [Anaerolineae bacterium]